MTFHWKTKFGSVLIPHGTYPNCYGMVRRGNTIFIRNYGRELKNGRGFNLIDRITWQIRVEEEKMRRETKESLFTTTPALLVE